VINKVRVSNNRGNQDSKARQISKDNRDSKAPVAHRVDRRPADSLRSLGPEGREPNRMPTEVRAILV
jgi:hypothetical protein